MNLYDLLLAAVLIVGLPLYVAAVRFPRLKAQVAAGIEGARTRAYREGMAVQWILLVLGLVIWLTTQPAGAAPRTLEALGLGLQPGLRLWIGVLLTAVILILLTVQRVAIERNRDNAVKVKEQMQNVGPLLPRTRKELSVFTGLSLTAGICEEVLYRGFLMGILFPLAGTWGALGLASVFFGLGHAYQGLKGILQTFAVGLALALLYVLTQSLWLPMIIHAFLDWNSGTIAHHVMNLDDSSADASLSA